MQARALIAEDEPLLAQSLTRELAMAWPELAIAATVGDGASAVREALRLLPNVLFLDIRMPGLSGLEAAADIADQWPEGSPLPVLVFVTAYDEYAVQAFEHAAVDYLLKPLQPARLQQCLDRIRPITHASIAQAATKSIVSNVSHYSPNDSPKHHDDDGTQLLLSQLRSLLNAPTALTAAPAATGVTASLSPSTQPQIHQAAASPAAGMSPLSAHAGVHHTAQAARLQRLQVSVGNTITMVPISEVIYFEAADKYVRVLTADKEYLIRTPIKDLLPQLDAQEFWQIHRSTIVRASAIASAHRDEAGRLRIRLAPSARASSETLAVSRLFAHLFKAM
jgi:DNA-binding LytR/AlgR family response regulator